MTRDIQLIVIGGSAGSLQVIFKIFKYIPADFPVPFLIALHRNVNFESALDELLSVKSNLKVKEVEEKDTIEPGYIYLCPADYHVLIEKNKTFALDYSEKIHHSRPSIDVVFKSASATFNERLLGILLSGANADGGDGLKIIKERGGLTIVQDPDESEVSYMPHHALQKFKADYVLESEEIGRFIFDLHTHA